MINGVSDASGDAGLEPGGYLRSLDPLGETGSEGTDPLETDLRDLGDLGHVLQKLGELDLPTHDSTSETRRRVRRPSEKVSAPPTGGSGIPALGRTTDNEDQDDQKEDPDPDQNEFAETVIGHIHGYGS